MELGFSDLFTCYEMDLETHVHEQIEIQLGFHELQIACYHELQVMRWKQKHMYMLCYGMYVSIVGYHMVYQYDMVCWFGIMLVSQGIVGYDMVWCISMVWYVSMV